MSEFGTDWDVTENLARRCAKDKLVKYSLSGCLECSSGLSADAVGVDIGAEQVAPSVSRSNDLQVQNYTFKQKASRTSLYNASVSACSFHRETPDSFLPMRYKSITEG